MNIGDTIETLRRKKKMKQGDLAKKANITQPYLSQIEGNKVDASMQTLTAIADALGIPIQLLMISSLSVNDVSDNKKEAYYRLIPLLQEVIDAHLLESDNDGKEK